MEIFKKKNPLLEYLIEEEKYLERRIVYTKKDLEGYDSKLKVIKMGIKQLKENA